MSGTTHWTRESQRATGYPQLIRSFEYNTPSSTTCFKFYIYNLFIFAKITGGEKFESTETQEFTGNFRRTMFSAGLRETNCYNLFIYLYIFVPLSQNSKLWICKFINLNHSDLDTITHRCGESCLKQNNVSSKNTFIQKKFESSNKISMKNR